MYIRNIVYVLALFFFIAIFVFIPRNQEVARQFINLWQLALTGIAIEAAIRIGKNKYLFFPVGYMVMFLYGVIDGPYAEYFKLLGGILHIGLAGMFLLEFKKIPMEDKEFRKFFLWIAIFSLLFSTKMLLMIPGLEFLSPFYAINISSIAIVGITGRYLLLKRLEPYFSEVAVVAGFLVIIHGFIVLESLMDKLFLG